MRKGNINEKWSKPLASILRKELKQRQRENKEYSQEDFADDLNLSTSTLSLLLKEERNPSLDSIFSIANALNCSVDYLVGLSPIKNREWNDLDKSISVISNESGLDVHVIETLIRESVNKDFASTISELITSNTKIMDSISDYLNYLPLNDDEVYECDAGKKYKIKNPDSSITTKYFLNVGNLNSMKIDEIENELIRFKELSNLSYKNNIEKIDYYQGELDDLDFKKITQELSDEEWDFERGYWLEKLDECKKAIKKYEVLNQVNEERRNGKK